MIHLSYPNESSEYRAARNALLDAEIALRRQLEAVAARRRALPPGGEVPEDYVFERIGADERPEKVRLSELFGEHPSILLYSFMYGPERDEPCTGCTHTLDGWDGSVFHADQRFPTYVVAKSPIARLEALARKRGWRNLKLLSIAGNDYSHHYFGDGTIRHFWGSELLYVQEEPGQDHRNGDLVDPVWGLLDMSLEGRGDFFPKLSYWRGLKFRLAWTVSRSIPFVPAKAHGR